MISNSRAKLKLFGAIGIVVFLLFVTSAAISFLHSPGTNEFRLHRSRYEQIIANVKAMKITADSSRYLWLSSNLDPATLKRKRSNNEDMVGKVEVFHAPTTDALTVIITTRDMGHFGTFGYAFTDSSNGSPPDAGMWQSEQKIDTHWWITANRSW